MTTDVKIMDSKIYVSSERRVAVRVCVAMERCQADVIGDDLRDAFVARWRLFHRGKMSYCSFLRWAGDVYEALGGGARVAKLYLEQQPHRGTTGV